MSATLKYIIVADLLALVGGYALFAIFGYEWAGWLSLAGFVVLFALGAAGEQLDRRGLL